MAIAIAGSRAWWNPCWNPLPAGKDKLAGAAPGAPTNENGTLSHTPAVLPIPAPAPAPPLALTKLVAKYTDANLQLATKLALELFVQGQQKGQSQIAPPALELQEKPFKAWFADLYYGNLHMNCYWFCQQCKDHFEIARAKRPNRIPFAASFLHGSVIQQWLKRTQYYNGAAPITWSEFKDFLHKNLGDSRAFEDNIWSKIKRDSQYQDKLVQEWATHLEYLQLILCKFNVEWAPAKDTMIRYFHKSLKLLI